ncbi:NAD(P)-dependent dehydrogenase (short-subunit alcohol dehydrogenase family) [Arthrobacter ginsengisoli]|uniref:NAD(P)-dependent dehydrogenase (Short-subunit alcohol dehydrogenase family) n=1 Tax=Arthrobacter ginsengisoli TaxID=1356565 RepID=A0ABU1UDM7_9MICC|nr:SDR family oxidoreductase [Arthrobacter ginsengisoli]MDR7083309.1 NAD(P)-dependent dehydrogenase (short-subunit alcohol dehydrogenase family) [Arthrobacter ginsengisoli]
MSGSDRVALVIGGGRGIAAAAVRALAGDGYRIAALSPSGSAMELARSLGGVGTQGSNRSVADLQAITDLALTTYGRIDVVVNSSGHAARKPVLEISDDEWAEGYEMYLLNVIRMTRIVTPHMVTAGGGAIVNVSTSSPFEPNPNYPVSGTFRAALGTFTKLYSDEYGPSGIRMNNVLPGFTKEDPSTVPGEWTTRIPLRRAASTKEVARVIRFLASEESSYITGQNIRVDGGASRSV